MSQSAALDAVIARIAAPERAATSSGADELSRLHGWWARRSDGTSPRAEILVATAGDGGADGAVSDGIAAADRAIDAGATLLIPRVDSSRPVVSRAVIGLLTRAEPAAIVFQAPGMTDREWVARCTAVRDLIATNTELRAQPVELLDELKAPALAFVVGVLLGSAARRTPAIIDGTDELAAAVIADRLSFRAKDWWRAASTSPDRAHQAAIDRVALDPGLPFDLDGEDDRGAAATVALLDLLATSRESSLD